MQLLKGKGYKFKFEWDFLGRDLLSLGYDGSGNYDGIVKKSNFIKYKVWLVFFKKYYFVF